MRPNSRFLTLFICLLLSCSACSKKPEAPVEVTPEETPVSAAQIPGALCSDTAPCAESFECVMTRGAFCEDDSSCADGEKCDAEIKTCSATRCVDKCTKTTKRYRYSDRKLLRLPSAKPALKDWLWGSQCSVKGQCSLEGERCVATKESCKDSLACTWFGECTEKEGKCIVEGESCKTARVCTQNGRCTLVEGACVATRNEDCEASEYCDKLRWCAVVEKYGICRRAPEDKSSGSVNLHGTKKLEKAEDLAIEPAENGHSVADVFAKRMELKDSRILVRGKVVKYTPGILQRNFIHLQDGSGSEGDKTHDLTVTTQEEAELGKIITVKGTVIVDRDFGSGYFYPVILEESKVIATD